MTHNTIPVFWALDIHGDGAAKLSTYPHSEHFSIPGPRMAELRAALVASDLDSLQGHYGTDCIDCPRCWLLVVRGEKKYSISLFPFEGGLPTPAQRRKARRALDVWMAVKRAAGQLDLPDVCSEMLGAKRPSETKGHPVSRPDR